MKEKLYTIELNDALAAEDECCFCWLERKLEQENLEFVLGSSYMESDIRDQTDQNGFCRRHTKMMFDYGNTLGNAWILKTRLTYLNRELKARMDQYAPGKSPGLFDRLKKNGKEDLPGKLSGFVKEQESRCYVCTRTETIYQRVLHTFVHQLQHDPAFGERLMNSKGFCIHHFGDVCQACETILKEEQKALWMPKLYQLMGRNLDRMQEDIDWLIEKYDYRNREADWKQSKDAVQRTMQKLVGGHPADPAFQNKK